MPDGGSDPAGAPPLIQLDGVGKTYQMGEVAVEALREVSFSIARGECLSIVGPSGSGKTTLLDILGCLSRPTRGIYRFDGIPIQDLSDGELARIRNRRIGFIFQTFHLLKRNTALANVALPLFYAGVPHAERMARAREALAAVGLAERMEHRPNQLSGGQQQRVAIARALVNRPDLILADEPTGNLDSKAGGEIMETLLSLHQRGHTLVLVTHDRELAGMTARTITLKDGKILRDLRRGVTAAGRSG